MLPLGCRIARFLAVIIHRIAPVAPGPGEFTLQNLLVRPDLLLALAPSPVYIRVVNHSAGSIPAPLDMLFLKRDDRKHEFIIADA